MEILTFTTLYPNPVQPHHGVFVENRLRHLISNGQVNARVSLRFPGFPFRHPFSVDMPITQKSCREKSALS